LAASEATLSIDVRSNKSVAATVVAAAAAAVAADIATAFCSDVAALACVVTTVLYDLLKFAPICGCKVPFDIVSVWLRNRVPVGDEGRRKNSKIGRFRFQQQH
jgi:hypothetical protein